MTAVHVFICRLLLKSCFVLFELQLEMSSHHFASPQLAFNAMQQKAHEIHVMGECFTELGCILILQACARV